MCFISGIGPMPDALQMGQWCVRTDRNTMQGSTRTLCTEVSTQTLRPLRRSRCKMADSEEMKSGGVRVNKCFKSFASRRQSDEFIEEGRVMINEHVARLGARVNSGDVVTLDGVVVRWERLTVDVKMEDFIYIKHWKDLNTICTTDERVENNIIEKVSTFHKKIKTDRVFPVGRLDESSTGLMLLTSDGRVPGAVLGGKSASEKRYQVTSDLYVSEEDVSRLREGVEISTVAQRDRSVRRTYVAKTLPCAIERGDADNDLIITLKEGRNRQIRKMLGAFGYTTRAIHRTHFMGFSLEGLSGPGDSCLLNADEMRMLQEKLDQSEVVGSEVEES